MFRDYIDNAGISQYRHAYQSSRECNFKDNPLIPSFHFPDLNRRHHAQISDFKEDDGKAISVARPGSLITQDPPFFSFYKGDFETVGQHILN
jgi:hypothetical protein